jgi:uncharacterized protein YciI
VHYVLIYEVGKDFFARRTEYRKKHLALAWEAADAGHLLLGGAFAEPTDQARLLFTGPSSDVAVHFAKADPYVRNGLVKSWRVVQWNTVVGKAAANPLRPE